MLWQVVAYGLVMDAVLWAACFFVYLFANMVTS